MAQDLKLTITADLGQAEKALNKLKNDAQGAGDAGAKALGRLESSVKGVNAAANTAALNKYERQLQQLNATTGRMEASFASATSGLAKFAATLGGLEAARRGVTSFIEMADEATRLDGRLKLVTSSTAEFNTVQKALFDISQRTRSELGANVELYTRSSQALKQLGATSQQTLQLTETLNQAFSISGATGSEASSSIIQLSQALASGTLRGEEFNSIAEQGPRIMQALADALGKTRGELRGLAEGGQLTSKLVFDALLSQAPKIAAEFGKVPRTVGQAMTQLGNDMLRVVGQTNNATGATNKLAEEIDRLRALVNTGGFGDAMVATVSSVVGFMNDIGSTVNQINGYVNDTNAAINQVGQEFNTALSYVNSATQEFQNFFTTTNDSAKLFPETWQEALSSFQKIVADAVTEAVGRLTAIPSAGKAAYDAFLAAWQNLPSALGGVVILAAKQALVSIEEMVDGAIALINNGIRSINDAVGSSIPLLGGVVGTVSNYITEISNTTAETAGKNFIDVFSKSFSDNQATAQAKAKEFFNAMGLQTANDKNVVDGVNKIVDLYGQAKDAAISFFDTPAKAVETTRIAFNEGITKPSKEAAKALKEAESAKKALFSEADAAVEEFFPFETAQKEAQRLTALINDTTNGLSDLQRQALGSKIEKNFSDLLPKFEGASQELTKYGDTVDDTREKLIDFQDIGESLFDTLNEGLSKGEGLLKSFANTFAKIANQLASQAFGKLFGGMFGNPSQTTGIGGQGASASSIATAIGNAVGGSNRTSPTESLERSVVPAFKNASTSFQAAAKAIRTIESGSAAGNYSAIGPATRTGDRALGAYQMMGANLPQWSREAIGREVGKTEFLKSVELQDKIFEHRFGGYMAKYGPEGASRAWFAGEGGMKNLAAKDVVGTSVLGYNSKFSSLYNQHGGGQPYRSTGSIDERETLRQGVSSGVIDAQKKIATGQAGVSSGSTGSDPWAGLRGGTSGAKTGSASGGGLFGGMNGMTGAGSILGVQYPAFSAMGGISAGLGGFGSGYSSGSPISGGLTGGLSGFMAGGPVGGLIGLGAGILGGVLGGRAQRKAAHQEAAKKWEEMRPAYEAFDQSLSGEGVGNLRSSIGDMWGQLSSFMETGGAAWKYGSGNSSAQFASTGTKMFAKWQSEINEFRDGFSYMLEDLTGGQGLEGAFAKGRSQVKVLDEQVKGFIDDVEVAFGSNDIGIPTSAAYDQMSKDTEAMRLEQVAKAKKAAGEYALTMLYSANATSDMQNTLDSFKGTAAGLQPVLERLGWSADEASKAISERLDQAVTALGEAFVDDLQSQINDLKGIGYFDDIKDLLKSRDTSLSDASLLGVDPSVVTEWFKLSAQNIVDSAELTGDAFDALVKKFPELEGVVNQFGAVIKRTASELKSTVEGYGDRYFAAVNDNSSLEGQLIAFDRQAAKERAAEIASGGQAINELEQTLSAERLKIVRDANKAILDQAKTQLQNLYESLSTFSKNVQEFITNMDTGASTTLSPQDQLAATKKVYDDTLAKANGGDEDARNSLLSVTQDYLDRAKEYYASSEGYAKIFDEVKASLKSTDTKTTTQLELARQSASWLSDIKDNTLTMAEALAEYVEAQKNLNVNRAWGVQENRNKAIVGDLSAQGINYTGNFGGGLFDAWTNAQSSATQALIRQIVAKYDKIYNVNQGMRLGGLVGAYANGGMVGNGIWNQDSVLAKFAGGGNIALAGGEMITRATSVNTQTKGMLDFINRTGTLPNMNDNSRMDGVERRLDRVIQTLAYGFNTSVSAIEEGNMIMAGQSETSKLMASR